MKLTTKKLKQLIREELAHMDETRVYQPGEESMHDLGRRKERDEALPRAAMEALDNFKRGLGRKLKALNDRIPDDGNPSNQRRFDKNITTYEQLRKAISQLRNKLLYNGVQMTPDEAMYELQMMGNFDAFFDD